ncbi:MAG: glutathione S-transferase [Candidatus Berkiella sp.]
MIIVHHLNNSRSLRIIWLLEELELEYEIKHYQREKSWRAPLEYKKLHPLGYSPVITDGEVTLGESGAIIEYILQQHGQNKLKPTLGSKEWVDYLFWLHFAEGTFMPVLFLKLVISKVHQKSPFFIKPVTKKINSIINREVVMPRLLTQIGYIESKLNNNEWLLGENFSAADIQLAIPLIWANTDAKLLENRPNILAYLARLKERPAYKIALEKGGSVSRIAD